MAAPSGLLEVHDEGLVLGRLGVRVADEGRQCIDQIPLPGHSDEAPMVRQPHRVHFLAVAVERGDPRRHDRDRFQVAAFAADLDPVAVGDAFFLRELDADFDELLRLDDRRGQHVLGPVVEVLGEPVTRRRVREVFRGAELLPIPLEDARGRVGARFVVVRVHRVVRQRRLERLVMLGQRSLGQAGRCEHTGHALSRHDEGPDFLVGRCIRPHVGHVGTAPGLAVPGDQPASWIPGFAGWIRRGAVVQDPAIRRPGPRPVQRLADAVRVGVVAPGHLVARLGPRTRVDPAAACRGAVVAQLAESGQQLAGLDQSLRLVKAGELLAGFGQLRDDGTTACGCWIYSGAWTQAGNQMARRDNSDPYGVGQTLNWAWSWPANRRILYNRASSDPSGKPWDPRRRLIAWNGKAWGGADVPDMRPDAAPDEEVGPFIMTAEGVARMFAPTGLAEGPLPEHYEPLESPLPNNPMHPNNDKARAN